MANEKSIGALWERKGILSGEITVGDETVKIVVFKNSFKKEEKHPDYRIFKQRPREDAGRDDLNDKEPF